MLLEHPACCKTNFTVGIIVKQMEFIFQAHESTDVTNLLQVLIKGRRVARSAQRLITGWTVWERFSVDTRISTRSDWPWISPSLHKEYWFFPRGKVQQMRAADHSHTSSAAGIEEYSHTSTHPLGHTGPVTGSLYLFYIYILIEDSNENIKIFFTTSVVN